MEPVSTITMAIKGAIFLSKSSAVKAVIMKYGPYMLASKGIADTAAAGVAVATAAGYIVSIKSIPERSVKGFTQIIDGINNGNASDFMDGIYQLSKAYNTAGKLLTDFNQLVDASKLEPEIKFSLKKMLNSMRPILEDEIERKSYALLKEIEEHLSQKGMTASEYSERIRAIYIKHTFGLQDNYQELLGRGGRIYSDISSLNQSLSIGNSDEYDHYLTYCIAGWIKENVHLSCVLRKSQKELARDITNQIFAYLKAYNM